MYPVINAGIIKITSYDLFALMAGFFGVIVSVLCLKKRFGRRPLTVCLPLLLVVFALLGARLFNVLLNPDAYPDLKSVFELQYKKMSLMGGLTLGALVILAAALVTKTDLGILADCFVLPGFVGIVLLKTGCFLNGCCFGKPAKAPFGVVFPANAIKYAFIKWLPLVKPTSQSVYPTQLYEIAGAVLALAAALLLRKWLKNRPGVFAAAFGAAFSLARLLVMPLRIWPYPDYIVRIVYPAFYALLILSGTGYILAQKRKPHTCADTVRKNEKPHP